MLLWLYNAFMTGNVTCHLQFSMCCTHHLNAC